jgi:hypothetical protein
MSAFTDIQGQLFVQMDAKARDVIEKRFGVRLDSMQSSEKQQAAWDVYQNYQGDRWSVADRGCCGIRGHHCAEFMPGLLADS